MLPPSAFDTLARLQVDYPMLFQLQSSQRGTMTHCGVLEFTAEEGSCYIPFWMMQNLLIEEGSVISVTNVSLPKATFVKLQPQNIDFLEITNPRAVLEHALRKYSCVTKGDTICVPYNDKNYHFRIQQVKPQDAACIIETDCNVDFDAPVGYEEQQQQQQQTTKSSITKKQSPYADTNNNNTASQTDNDGEESEAQKPAAIQIVNGKIIRNDEANAEQTKVSSKMMAAQTGTTGVQQNSAVSVKAPEISYWALSGDGARLDGKTPAELKDTKGDVVDIRAIRAEAASKRLAAQSNHNMPQQGTTVDGTSIVKEEPTKPKVPVSKRKSRVGQRYSKLKSASAFEGSANRLQK